MSGIKNQKKKIKPDNESRIIWANDSLKNKTAYCLLYVHGFSASWYEGNPAHIDFAHRYGMNLYIPLLASHGIDTTEALIDMTPDRLYESAKEALVVAQSLGRKSDSDEHLNRWNIKFEVSLRISGFDFGTYFVFTQCGHK